ncbi:uncharacterized protein BCR38DRAFT_404500 [Pseudomassariella vexata]|uniref:Uncharacterized protein n=1 Tax=Pseudomassariella vexata TaxID=1141098 RepID=A0A1Y2EIK0_9PEZI|nr:uncharacterized protein BCR38DRAFT_404500 [Pseudomassariella vexata]ORY71411.1 hypothetical protein BCR38DRAFT_404500 [Pseudomassariella vexata]
MASRNCLIDFQDAPWRQPEKLNDGALRPLTSKETKAYILKIWNLKGKLSNEPDEKLRKGRLELNKAMRNDAFRRGLDRRRPQRFTWEVQSRQTFNTARNDLEAKNDQEAQLIHELITLVPGDVAPNTAAGQRSSQPQPDVSQQGCNSPLPKGTFPVLNFPSRAPSPDPMQPMPLIGYPYRSRETGDYLDQLIADMNPSNPFKKDAMLSACPDHYSDIDETGQDVLEYILAEAAALQSALYKHNYPELDLPDNEIPSPHKYGASVLPLRYLQNDTFPELGGYDEELLGNGFRR